MSMEGAELKEGKARVREHLIDPLERDGLVRKRGVTLQAHQDRLDGLAARLAYMTAENLRALAEVVATYGGGPRKDVWPTDVSICNWARRLQTPPISESRLVRSYIQSAAGMAAIDGGYVVELFEHLKRYGAPPDVYSLSKIRTEADQRKGRRARIERERERGIASQPDLDWLERQSAVFARCMAIVEKATEGAGNGR